MTAFLVQPDTGAPTVVNTTPPPSHPGMQQALVTAMPALFVLLWSTGFIGAKYGLPHAEPFTFLSIRAVITLVLMVLIVRVLRSHWPRRPVLWLHLAVTGLLVHGCYLSGVFYAIHLGMPAGLASLLVGLQPLLTAVLARRLLGEPVAWWQWLGMILGLVGIALVLHDKLDPGVDLFAGFGAGAVLAALIALFGISLGTLYQKRYCTGVSLLTGTTVQYLGMSLLTVPAAFLFETRQVDWTLEFVLALAWLVLVLSIAAILLLMALIRRGAASRVASLFYLVPPVTALQAWWLFDERFGPQASLGLVVAVAGVALALRARAPA